MNPLIEIITYQPEHQPWFEAINCAWIEKYFHIEEIDAKVLQHPDEQIIQPGGMIFMALAEKEMAGTAALKLVEPGVYEFTKMGVLEKFQGRKIGEMLSHVAIQYAKSKKAKKIVLYSNTKLVPAMRLYDKLGFVEVPLDGPYKRSDIKMELVFSSYKKPKFAQIDRGVIGLL